MSKERLGFHQPYKIDNSMSIWWQRKEYRMVKINQDTGNKEYNVIIAKLS